VKTLVALVTLAIGICLCMATACRFGVALGGWSRALEPEGQEHRTPVASATTATTASVAESTVILPSASPTEAPAATVAASATMPTAPAVDCTCAVVTSVVDGDTIVLDTGETVRYIGIDTPEADECYGPEATEMNRQLVEGKTVILISDVEDRGRYNRLLRYVIVDGRFVNAELVRLGYASAESYGDNVMFQQVLTIFEHYASESGAGLWSSCGTD